MSATYSRKTFTANLLETQLVLFDEIERLTHENTRLQRALAAGIDMLRAEGFSDSAAELSKMAFWKEGVQL